MKRLQEYLQEQSFVYRDEMVVFLYDEYNISISVSAVGKLSKGLKYLVKRYRFQDCYFWKYLIISFNIKLYNGIKSSEMNE